MFGGGTPVGRGFTMKRLLEKGGMGLVCVIMILLCAIFVPHFASTNNITALLMSISTIGMVACTMMLCLAAGDFDLSIGSTLALAGVVSAIVINATGNIFLAVIIPLALGAFIGSVNGIVIAQFQINPLIATLAVQQVVRGAALLITKGSSIGISNEAFGGLGKAKLLIPVGVPPLALQSPVWVMAIIFVVFGVILNRTTFGRNTLGVGGNKEAARLAGISVTKTKIGIFLLQGMVAALAGVLAASRVSSGQPNAAQGLELQAISGCVLGGVSLTGGVARIQGVVVGVLIMGILQNAMSLQNIDAFWQLVTSGGVLLVAVLLDRWKNRA